jgi:hypothetical protein
VDLLFRDQSQAVANKVQERKKKLLEIRAAEDEGEQQSCTGFVSTLPPSLDQPVDDHQAFCYFMSFYVNASPFEYLPALYGKAGSDDALSTATLAAAWASLSLHVEGASRIRTARTYYSKALIETNKALRNPKRAVLDSTLASVLLLGLFEAVMFPGQRPLESWNAHTMGAVTLLRFLGLQQFQSRVGCRLFL